MDWLQELKAGDKVIISRRGSEDVVTVKRTTKTLIIVISGKYESKFSRKYGQSIGTDVWSSESLHPATEEKVKEIKNKNRKLKLIMIIGNYNLKSLSVEKLQEISDILSMVGEIK